MHGGRGGRGREGGREGGGGREEVYDCVPPSPLIIIDIGPEPEMILSTEGTPMNGELQTMPPVPHEPPTESSGMGPPPVMLVEDPSDPAAAMEMKPPSPAGREHLSGVHSALQSTKKQYIHIHVHVGLRAAWLQ